MADDRDAAQKAPAAAQADLELSEKDAEDVKGGAFYSGQKKKKKKGGSASGTGAFKPM